MNSHIALYEVIGEIVPMTVDNHATSLIPVLLGYLKAGHPRHKAQKKVVEQFYTSSHRLRIRKYYENIFNLSNFGDQLNKMVWLNVDVQEIPRELKGIREQVTQGVVEGRHRSKPYCRYRVQQTLEKKSVDIERIDKLGDTECPKCCWSSTHSLTIVAVIEHNLRASINSHPLKAAEGHRS